MVGLLGPAMSFAMLWPGALRRLSLQTQEGSTYLLSIGITASDCSIIDNRKEAETLGENLGIRKSGVSQRLHRNPACKFLLPPPFSP